MFVINKSTIKMFLTSNHCFQLKYDSSIHIVDFSSGKNMSNLYQGRNMHRPNTANKQKTVLNCSKYMLVDFDVR